MHLPQTWDYYILSKTRILSETDVEYLFSVAWIRQKEKKLEHLLEQYENDATQLREKRREIISEARDEARRILDSSNASIERTIHEIKQAQAEKERTLEARRRLQEEKKQLTTSKKQPLVSVSVKVN